ncbi:hypothetical protein [Shewanella aestuarii]|uniref:Uncharacterized protein n=1 Tax=Shewanella aestuarii TaxID=1028752 RepID=A0A6G9QMN0_9GAMM|nr:hypothetical protein [Shewanella aestuarii]QIR15658.1 hypothetical protein HBH39_15165 [Shewanella aestuarii]
MNKSMYIIISVVFIFALLIGYGFMPASINHQAISQTDESAHSANTQLVNLDDVMLALFSFQTDKQWQIQLPESPANKPIFVPLTELKRADNIHLAIGHYQDAFDSGSVALDYSKITPINLGNPEQEMLFAAPFAVSNQGSGNFWYLGLFRLNNQTAHISHLDSMLLGDRIKLNTIGIPDPLHVSQLKISYWQHGEQQAMAEVPNQLVEQNIAVSFTGLTKITH